MRFTYKFTEQNMYNLLCYISMVFYKKKNMQISFSNLFITTTIQFYPPTIVYGVTYKPTKV